MPLLLENAHATALLSRVMNLVKEAVEHLNPDQTPVLTMDQQLSTIAKEIPWLCPDSFSNNKYVIMIGVGGGGGGRWGRLHVWDGWESGWMVLGGQVQSQLLEQCCRIFCESMLSCEDKTCPPGYSWIAAYSASFLLFLMCSLSLIMLSAPNSDKQDGDWTTAV